MYIVLYIKKPCDVWCTIQCQFANKHQKFYRLLNVVMNVFRVYMPKSYRKKLVKKIEKADRYCNGPADGKAYC